MGQKYFPGKSKQFFQTDCRLLNELFLSKSVNTYGVLHLKIM